MNEESLAAMTALRALIGVLGDQGVLSRDDILDLRNRVTASAQRIEDNPHWDKSGNSVQALRVFASDFAHDFHISDME